MDRVEKRNCFGRVISALQMQSMNLGGKAGSPGANANQDGRASFSFASESLEQFLRGETCGTFCHLAQQTTQMFVLSRPPVNGITDLENYGE